MGKKRMKRMVGKHASETYKHHGVVYRVCTTCGEHKVLASDYHRNGNDEHGAPAYRLDCKTCYNAKRKENRVSNKHATFVGHQRARGEKDINYTFAQWRETVIFFGGVCCYCGRTMRKGETLTKDHLEAFSKGGKTEQANTVPACTSCNCSKGDSEWRSWYMAQSFFSQERMNKIFQWRNIMAATGGGCDGDV